jgi:hypothetical protein
MRASTDDGEQRISSTLPAEVVDLMRAAAVHNRVLRASCHALRVHPACARIKMLLPLSESDSPPHSIRVFQA